MRKHIETLAVLAISAATFVGIIAADTAAQAAQQPYGGCAEAWQAPASAGAEQCRDNGWKVTRRLVVNPHGVVRFSALPSCRYEDASSGPVPCSWNFGTTDGNGRGLAFWVTRDRGFRYVWAQSPAVGRWDWATELDARLDKTTAGPRDWSRCVFRVADTTVARCADGTRVVS